MSENVLILGATSGIAKALAAVLAARGCRLVLGGRNREEMDRIAADLRLRFSATVDVETFDALDYDHHAEFFRACLERSGGCIDGVIHCYGYLPDQKLAQEDFTAARQTIEVNFTSAVSLLNLAADYFERQQAGYIAAISSVAGDRGRQSNYVYGSTKAALSAYLSGLRNRLFHAGVHVLTIKPGFVDTPMIAGSASAKSPLVASPQRVARDIDRAIRRRKNTVYTPWFWRIVMGIIRAIPECIFKRMRL